MWCVVTKDHFWTIPLITYTPNEDGRNLNLPFSFPINDEITTIKESRDKISFTISTTISHETTVSGKRVVQSTTLREDTFKAENQATAKKWISFLSCQNINHQITTTKQGGGNLSTKLVLNNQTIDNDNDVFASLEDEIARSQLESCHQDLENYNKIYSLKEMILYR
jgi:hypothetical protein